MAEKVYDEEGFEIDDSGERVLDDDGNPILKVEEKSKEGETAEEKVVRLEKENVDIAKERDGIKADLIESRGRRRDAEEAIRKDKNVPQMTKEEMEEWLDTPMTRREFEKNKQALLDEMDAITRTGTQKASLATASQRFKDFDEVKALADELLKNPKYAHQKIALDYAEDYAEAIYQLGMTHPEYIEKVKLEASGKVVKNIKKTNEKPSGGAGGAGAGGGGGPATDDDDLTIEGYSKLTQAQKDALPQATKERILGAID